MGVIGTAGHVDHGKSSLVRALTGIDPDRLREEKEREMTIDLGFAWLDLPDGQRVGIVDVPGHKDFIKNMLAGVGGIDAALLVVAADEGIMPQTREHLDILNLMQVSAGVIALTKIDMVDDPDWIDLVEADLSEQLEDTPLEHAPILRVSSRTGQGIAALKEALAAALQKAHGGEDRGRGRLPIDRVFSIAGFGTVVTGTLVDGLFQVGDEIEVQPAGLKGRIRGLQSHKEKMARAYPGNRVAINLSGISTDDIRRGDVICLPGTLKSTTMIDATLHYLADAPLPLKHNMSVDFFTGSAESPASIRLLDKEVVKPGERAWVQVRLETPVAVLKLDRFIIRLASPSLTTGGGTIIEPHPHRRHRRFRPDVLAHLETLAYGSPAELLLQAVQKTEPCTLQELRGRSPLSAEETAATLEGLLRGGDLVVLSAAEPNAQAVLSPGQLLLSRAGWSRLRETIERLLSDYHLQFPLRIGMPREELKSRLQLAGKTFNALMEYALRAGVWCEESGMARLPDHTVSFSPAQQAKIDSILAEFRRQPFTPPGIPEIEKVLGAELLAACFEQVLLVRLIDDVAYLPETYQLMREKVLAHLQHQGKITVAEVRDMFGASRRYALAFMGYLDQIGLTRRVGDERVLR